MTSAIGSSVMSAAMYSGMRRLDLSQMVDNLFTKIDTKGQGYIDKTELQTALDQMSSDGTTSDTSSSSSAPSVDELFTALDSNGDNQLTQQEMTEGLKKLAAEFESQSSNTGIGGMPPPPPPPPPSDTSDTSDGLSKSELTTMASDLAETDSIAASSLTQLVQSFDEADTNQDGKISIQEAMAFQAKTDSSSTTSTASSASSATTSSSTTLSSGSQNQGSDVALMRRIGQLLSAYGGFNQDFGLSGTSSLSVAV